MASHGTKKSRQNGPNTRMIPMRTPEGQTPSVRMPCMLTPPIEPIEPDCPRIRRSGNSVSFGNLAMRRNQPENTARTVVIASHSDAKNSGKKTTKFCSIKLFNVKPLSIPGTWTSSGNSTRRSRLGVGTHRSPRRQPQRRTIAQFSRLGLGVPTSAAILSRIPCTLWASGPCVMSIGFSIAANFRTTTISATIRMSAPSGAKV